MSGKDTNWNLCNTDSFWNDIATNDHLVQIYDTNEVLLNSLEGFSISGLQSNESVVIIATQSNLDKLKDKLENRGFDLQNLINDKRYVPIEAYEMLSVFMKTGWPDQHLFNGAVSSVFDVIQKTDKKIIAYCEMVDILWNQGYTGATTQLEDLWNKVCQKYPICLFCAYSKSTFTNDTSNSIHHVCALHTKIIAGDISSETDVIYKFV